MVLLFVSCRSLACQSAMAGQQLTMVGGENNDGVFSQIQLVQRIEQRGDFTVSCLDAIELEILPDPNRTLIIRNHACEQGIGIMIDAVCGHPARLIERLLPGCGEPDLIP